METEMKRIAGLALFGCLAGCSDAGDKAAAMTAFIHRCKAPVNARMTLTNDVNKIELACPELKPSTTVASQK